MLGTERTAMAATPTAMQMKRRAGAASRSHLARRHAKTNVIRRLSRSTSCASAIAELGIVRHEHERGVPRPMHFAQEIHDVASVCRVEVARWLVGQHDWRIVGERPASATRRCPPPESCDAVMGAAGETHFEQPARALRGSATPAISSARPRSVQSATG